MKIANFNRQPSLQDALDVIDALRKDVLEGKISAFFVSALDDADATIVYTSSTKPVSRLRLQGAMSQALHDFQRADII